MNEWEAEKVLDFSTLGGAIMGAVSERPVVLLNWIIGLCGCVAGGSKFIHVWKVRC